MFLVIKLIYQTWYTDILDYCQIYFPNRLKLLKKPEIDNNFEIVYYRQMLSITD